MTRVIRSGPLLVPDRQGKTWCIQRHDGKVMDYNGLDGTEALRPYRSGLI